MVTRIVEYHVTVLAYVDTEEESVTKVVYVGDEIAPTGTVYDSNFNEIEESEADEASEIALDSEWPAWEA